MNEEELRALIAENAKAIKATDEAIKETSQQVRNLAGIVQIVVRELEAKQQETSDQIQVLIGESRENTRQHSAFRESFAQLLTQVVERLNAIWVKANGLTKLEIHDAMCFRP